MSSTSRLSILAIDPYLAGSHAAFLSGLRAHSQHQIEVWSMPPRKWKWRMRASAINFAQKLEETTDSPDLFFVSDFLDVAAFKALLPERYHRVPILTYFHENQLTYPVQEESERDYQFSFTNVTTCLASDRVLFNSEYHREDFLAAVPTFLRRMPDFVPPGIAERIRAKSGVQHLGITMPRAPESGIGRDRGDPPRVVLWNHRWEYDKNPDLFFRALLRLDLAGVEFRLVVLGESFRDSPPIFEEARQRLSHRLLHWGFAKSIEEYWEWLYRCDVVVSTSLHEFFGVSVVEGIAAGCFPLLPLRLSYPELLPESLREVCYYRTDKEFEERLTRLLTGPLPSVGAPLAAAAQRFLWPTRIQGFDRELEEIVALALHRPVE